MTWVPLPGNGDAFTLMKTEINFIFVGELIALLRYGPIFIYGKLVIELLKFIWGDSNTEFKDVDFGGKKLTLKQKKNELNTTFSESLLNSELIKSAHVYSLSFLGDCEGFISMTLSQFFISQDMQLNIILNSFYLFNHKA